MAFTYEGQVWHLITGRHLRLGTTPTSGNAQDLSQYDPVEQDVKL